jgi:hypothetical protein
MLTLTFSQGLPGEDGDGVVVGGREEEEGGREGLRGREGGLLVSPDLVY